MDFFQRENASFEYEVFFLKKYPKVLLADAGDTYLLQEEFVIYQPLSIEDILWKVWDEGETKLASEENDEKPSCNFEWM